MEWMGKHNERRLHPECLLPQAASILVLAMNYYQAGRSCHGLTGSQKYALGDDYSHLILSALKKNAAFLWAQV